MILTPRYDGPTILSVDGHPADQLEPLMRQRRRMQAMLAGLTDDEWMSMSRCAEWTVRDVVAHLVGVNSFWHGSIVAGLAGTPTRILGGGFDPATTPSLMVNQMNSLTIQALLDQFVSTNEALIGVVSELTDAAWSMLAESPAGHVPIRLVAQHALWDSWVHERDVVIPLGIPTAAEQTELRSCLLYAAAVSPALGFGFGRRRAETLGVEASNPRIGFMIEVGESVSVRDVYPTSGVPCLRGEAVALIEALSLRAPMAPSAPIEWTQLIDGLAIAFDAV
ncbi:MAG: maleylpyruvate isomerase family mycothiol-dependent enzyme [Ilumatobacteraceae bacterium]